MKSPYTPPRRLAHLATTVNAARTQLGWGLHDDGSVGLEHIISANPFAGKAKSWGIATIDDNGDIQVVSNGPGNAELDQPIPKELIDQIVHFYEGEGLNVRNIHEHDPSKEASTPDAGFENWTCPECGSAGREAVYEDPEGGFECRQCGRAITSKVAEIERGQKACPHCGENADLYTHPTLGKFECENCGTVGELDDLIDFGDDPDPDRNMFEDNDDYPDQMKNDDWADYEASVKTAGVSFQGAPAGGNTPASGIAVRPDRQNREEIEKMVGGLNADSPHDIQKNYVHEMNEGMGTNFPQYDNPFVNRGGSFGADDIDDHFFETVELSKEAAPDPAGVPGTGIGDTRNFDPQNQPGFIVVSSWLTPDDNWLFTDKCKGIVAERGGVTSHGAVIARAMGIPAIVDAAEAVGINPGDQITMDPNTGRVDVNGGNVGFQEGEVRRAHNELVRFVWSAGQGIFSQVTRHDGELVGVYQPGTNDASHQSMIEYLEDEDQIDYNDFTFGVIYDDGTAEYYQPCQSAPEMENWLRSTFPNMVQNVVLKQTAGGIYQPVAAANDTEPDKAPECPTCGSHSYDVIAFPDGTIGDGLLRCLNDGTEYKHRLIMNPKGGKVAWLGMEPYQGLYEALMGTALAATYGVDWVKQLAQRLSEGETPEEVGLSPEEAAEVEDVLQWDFPKAPEHAAMVKEAPGNKHLPYATPKRNRQYEHILESCRDEHPDWSEDRCKELAARTVNKQRAEKGETKSSEDCGCSESKLIFVSAEVPAINDTNGSPLKIGDLYLMHSTQYPVPDVVRITNINEKRIEAHIDSDVRGMFPIEIDPAEFANLGYSFEPYTATKEAIATPSDQILHRAVQSVLESMVQGITDQHELRKDPYVEQAVQKALTHFGDPARALQALNDADSFGNFMRYYSKEAARALHISPKRQKELINENPKGRARNFEKLNLEGTHYTHSYTLIPGPEDDEIDAHFLW